MLMVKVDQDRIKYEESKAKTITILSNLYRPTFQSILVDLRVTIGPRPTNVILQLQSASRETGSKRLLKRVREPSVETKTKATAKDTEGNIQIAILKA
ncbi:hypothetical protein V6N13_074739 [Hibiscus sabdariffa]